MATEDLSEKQDQLFQDLLSIIESSSSNPSHPPLEIFETKLKDLTEISHKIPNQTKDFGYLYDRICNGGAPISLLEVLKSFKIPLSMNSFDECVMTNHPAHLRYLSENFSFEAEEYDTAGRSSIAHHRWECLEYLIRTLRQRLGTEPKRYEALVHDWFRVQSTEQKYSELKDLAFAPL